MRREHAQIFCVVLLSFLLLGGCGQGTTSGRTPGATPGSTATPQAAATSPAAVATTAANTPVASTPAAAAPLTSLPPTPSPTVVAGSTAVAPAPAATPAPFPAGTPLPRAGLPVRLKIPTIGVDAAIEYVGLTPAGAMDVPKDYASTAWYEPGPRPGERGNAVIAGHVDSQTGKAVFWDLSMLKPGDPIIVTGDDGVERRFTVNTTEVYRRADAPLERVFGPAAGARLNLITCDPESGFDQASREYGGNIVVYTEAAPEPDAPDRVFRA